VNQNLNKYFLNKNVLVTGASGFIGSRLINHLSELGAAVHALSRNDYSECKNNVRWHKINLVNYNDVETLFQKLKPDFIFHLASEVTGKRDLDMVLPTLNNNLISTVHILTASSKISCKRILLAGSLEEPYDNHVSPIPAFPYAAAKWASSGYARMFNTLYSTPVILTKIFMVYGPGQSDLNKLIPYVILSILRNKAPKLSSGIRSIDWIFVDDVVEGLLSSATLKNCDGKTIDIGSGNLVTTREIVEMIFDLMKSGITPEFGTLPERPMEQIRVANSNIDNKLPNWAPKFSLEKGLKITIDWYRNQFELGRIS